MTTNTCSSYFLLLLSAFYTWHRAEPISKTISVYALFFPHKKLLLFLIIADLNDIHLVTCLFNVFHFIYRSFEIIISLLLVQQNNWSCGSQNSPEQDSLHRHYVNTASKDLVNIVYEEVSSLARIFLRWFCTGSNFLHSKYYCYLCNHFCAYFSSFDAWRHFMQLHESLYPALRPSLQVDAHTEWEQQLLQLSILSLILAN